MKFIVIDDHVLIVSFFFRKTIHLTAFSDERLLWEEKKSHTSVNTVNTESFKKGRPQQQYFTILKKKVLAFFRNYKKKKYVKGEKVILLKN